MRSEAFLIRSRGAYTIFSAWQGRNYNIHDRVPEAKVVLSAREAKMLFPHTGLNVPHCRPAPKRKYGIFGLNVRKNSIRSTGVKFVSPHLV